MVIRHGGPETKIGSEGCWSKWIKRWWDGPSSRDKGRICKGGERFLRWAGEMSNEHVGGRETELVCSCGCKGRGGEFRVPPIAKSRRIITAALRAGNDVPACSGVLDGLRLARAQPQATNFCVSQLPSTLTTMATTLKIARMSKADWKRSIIVCDASAALLTSPRLGLSGYLQPTAADPAKSEQHAQSLCHSLWSV